MEALYTWIRNLAGYFLFVTVLEQLLPGKKYGKYVRLFAGMVLILLVLQPFLDRVWLEEQIARAYESLVFQYEAEDLEKDLLGIETQRLSQMISQYENAVAEDVRQIAEDAGYAVTTCRVQICRDQDAEEFGTVTAVSLGINDERSAVDADEEKAHENEQIPTVIPVVVELGKPAAGEEKRQLLAADHPAAEKLRRRIASYYHLEESYVEIQVSEGKR